LDLPQFLSGNQERINIGGSNNKVFGKSKEGLKFLFESIRVNREYIKGLHLWSRDKSLPRTEQHHSGTFDNWFDYRLEDKNQILSNLRIALADGQPRYFVPEVNSSQADFNSILNDIISNGFKFIK